MFVLQLDTELTARHELQVEFKKMEGDYEQKVQELCAEKEALRNDKVDKEKENQGLHGEIGQLKQQVLSHIRFTSYGEPCRMEWLVYSAGSTAHWATTPPTIIMLMYCELTRHILLSRSKQGQDFEPR